MSMRDPTSNKISTPPQLPPVPRIISGTYLSTEEVARYIGVDKSTVRLWRNKNYFNEDFVDHNGKYLYSTERVEQLKQVYKKG